MDVEKYISRMEKVFENLKILSSDNGTVDMAKRYLSDAKYFLEKRDKLRAVEALAISWAYIDALARLNIVEVSDSDFFTIE